MRQRKRKGFTLIELLVVITVLGILMAVLLPKIFQVQADSNSFACARNMESIYKMIFSYKRRHDGRWPSYSGVKFFLCLTQDPMFQRTEDNVAMFFCPSTRSSDNEYGIALDDPDEWLTDLESAGSEHSSYAGRDMARFKRLRASAREVIMADDNEDGISNHPGSMCVLFADGKAKEMSYEKWAKKELITLEEAKDPDFAVIVGPDSQITVKICDLTKLKID